MPKTIKILVQALAILLILSGVLFAGYELLGPKPDPLAGWQIELKPMNALVEKDYQDYIRKLPDEKRTYAHAANYLKDGTGQHALVIEIDLDGTAWNHVLFYNKDNKRIKVLKYVGWHYMS